MIKTQKVEVIDMSDWDDLVSETYNKPYSFQQQNGCKERQRVGITVPVEHPYDYKNTKIPYKINGDKMGVSFETWLNTTEEDIKEQFPDRDDRMSLDIFWDRNFYPHVDMIINDLHSKGLLEAGEYEIDIDW